MNTKRTEIYLPDSTYQTLVVRLAEVMPLIGVDHLREGLGPMAGIWPEYVREENQPPLNLALAS